MRTVLIPALLLSLVAAGCAGGDGASGDGSRTVVAAFFPLAEAARLAAAAGADEGYEVSDLTPAGTEPHDLELTPDQIDDLLDAELAVVLGGGFQPAVEDVVDDRDGDTLVVLDELGIDSRDPHVWLDPLVMADIVDAVAPYVGAADTDAIRLELEALDERFRTTLASCERDLVVASHDAYGHLTDRYGLRLETISGLAPEDEPDPARLDELADLVEREQVTTVFVEPLVPRAAVETLARESGAAVAELDPLESDPGVGYVEAMDRNREALAAGLGCAAG